MDRDQFLQKILPDTTHGTYVATIGFTPPDGKTVLYNKGFDSIEAMTAFCTAQSVRGNTSYFALGTFKGNHEIAESGKDRWRRKADMATAFKTFALDIDCGDGKPYPTAREGAVALGEFLRASGMPKPMIVSSGYGLHCYWPLETAITRDQWVVTARQLRELCIMHGLQVDESKVCDPSMVLRPLDTTNWKRSGNRPVTFLRDTSPVPPGTIIAAVAAAAPRTKTPTTRINESPLTAIIDSLYDNVPIDADKILRKCSQLRAITFNNGEGQQEPTWYAALGIAAYCDNAETVAIEWSRGHHSFDAATTIHKMHQWKANSGPTTCSRLNEIDPKGCTGCKFANKITSPIQLGRPEPKAREVNEDPLVPHPCIPPPKPFIRNDKGGVDAIMDEVAVPVSLYDLFPLHITNDPHLGYEECVFLWNKPHRGYSRMTVRMAHVFSDNTTDLNNTLADNGFLVAGKDAQRRVAQYMRAYIQSLQAHQATHELHTSLGWKHDGNSFILGTTQFRRESDGTVTSKEVGISRALATKNLDRAYSPKGKLAIWQTWTKLFDHPEMKLHGYMLGQAFAAPLIYFTGLKGVLISMVGDTGSGKSTLQRLIQSVYGDPELLELKKDDTQLAVVQRMGMVSNLPITIDECTHMEPKVVGNFAYWGSQGCDRHRQTDTVSPNLWALVVSLSSNKSLRDKINVVMPGDEAMSMRLVEFTMNRNSVFDDSHDYGRRLSYMMMDNYGVAGPIYISYLLSLGPDEIKRRWDIQVDAFGQKYGVKFSGKERYWLLAYATIDLGLQFAKEAGVINYNIEACTAEAVAHLDAQREIVKDSIFTPFDMLATYINSNIHAAVTVEYDHRGTPHVPVEQPTKECFIRKELSKDKNGAIRSGFLYIDKNHFRHWAMQAGWDMKKITETFDTEGVTHSPNAYGKISMGKHTRLRLGQVPVIGLNLTHGKMSHMLDIPLVAVEATQLKEATK